MIRSDDAVKRQQSHVVVTVRRYLMMMVLCVAVYYFFGGLSTMESSTRSREFIHLGSISVLSLLLSWIVAVGVWRGPLMARYEGGGSKRKRFFSWPVCCWCSCCWLLTHGSNLLTASLLASS